jgi:enamine deaminase RidA (YjgF/YER057c/UK114 family)
MKKEKNAEAKTGVDTMVLAARAESSSHPLFDSGFYNEQLPQFARQTDQAMHHFLTVGEKLGLQPHPVFDRSYVLEQAKDNGAEIGEDFSPFTYVLANNLSPSRLFSTEVYARSLREVGVELPEGVLYIAHFLTKWHEYRVPFSPYFDVRFYELNNPHLATSGTNPLDHYFRVPRHERADANPMFHAGYYRHTYASDAQDPLVDFLAQGCGQRRLPNPYAAQELLSEAFVTPENLLKYIETGA